MADHIIDVEIPREIGFYLEGQRTGWITDTQIPDPGYELFVGGPLHGRLMGVTQGTHVVETFEPGTLRVIAYRQRRMAVAGDPVSPPAQRDTWERPFWAPTDLDEDEAVDQLRSYLTVLWTCHGTHRRISRV